MMMIYFVCCFKISEIYHVVFFASRMISAKPVHGVFSVPLHHLPALGTCVPEWATITVSPMPRPHCTHKVIDRTARPYLESIILLAASAYLNNSFRASSLYLMRDSLRHTFTHTGDQKKPKMCHYCKKSDALSLIILMY